MKVRVSRQLLMLAGVSMIFCCGEVRAWAAPTATTTTVAVTSGGSMVTTVASGSVVTLTATVSTGASAVTVGQVKFCDASAAYCTDIHVIGIGQLTSAGTAVLKLIPGIGSHSYKAVFLGTTSDATSASSAVALTATAKAKYPTAAAITQNGNPGNYVLTATVGGAGGVAPTGTVSFIDTSNGNAIVGTVVLPNGLVGTQLTFRNSLIPVTTLSPKFVSIGDFNGDGITDLAVANYGSNTVLIILGNGDGTFTQAAKSPAVVGVEPSSIAVGDLNEDGIADLAVANSDSTVTILLGKGDGTFTQAANSPVTVVSQPVSSPNSIAVGDFNGDGIPDLAVAYIDSATVNILLGNGDGTFRQTSEGTIFIYFGGNSIAVGDFNGDGIPDLVGTDQFSGTVGVLLGIGDGTFKPTTMYGQATGGASPVALAAADLVGYGTPSLAVANWSTNTVSILIGGLTPFGTFEQAPNSPIKVGADPSFVAVGDFNMDGVPDLAITNASSGTLTILLGNKGNGTFTEAPNSPVTVGSEPVSVAVGDFNGDGIPDMAVTNEFSNTVTVLLSQSTQTVTANYGISLIGTGTHQVEASYSGDSNYNSSVSSAMGLPAQQVTPTINATASSSSITTAQPLTVTTAVNGGSLNPTATGTVTLTSGSYTSTATTLSSGSATITVPAGSLVTGLDTLTVNYSGDGNYNAITGTTSVNVTVQHRTPTMNATASTSSITTTQPLTVTTAVNGGSGNPTATGTVTLTSGSYTSAAATLSSGSATIAVPAGSLVIGMDTLTVNYSGDGNYNAITGTTSVNVTTAVSPSFAVSGTAVTLARGATTGNTSTITVTPAGGFIGSVGLTAAVTSSPTGAQYPPTLSFGSTNPVSITGIAAGTATLTISSTAATSATLIHSQSHGSAWYEASSSTLACVLLFGIPKRRKWRTVLVMLVSLVALTGGVLACSGGGGSSGVGAGGTSNPGTTAGVYTVTVTDTSGTATGKVALTVQ